jgi:hypothetical protein
MLHKLLPEEEQRTAVTASSLSTEPVALEGEAVQHEAGEHALPMELLLTKLKRQSRRHAWFGGIAAVLGLLLGGIVVLSIIMYLVMSGMLGHAAKFIVDFSPTSFATTGQISAHSGQVAVSGLTPLLLLIGSSVFAFLTKRERIQLTKTLLQYEDLRAIGPLAEALYLQDKAVRTEAAASLARLLPRLREEDASLLDDHQRLLLSLYLGRSRWSLLEDNDALSLAIVEAYWHIGNGSEVPTVKRIAQGKGSAAKDARVREAAQRYVAEMQRRAELARQPETLLRASASVNANSEMLLHPAVQTPATDPAELLRATEQVGPK